MIRSIEEWRKIREVVEKGLSLNRAAKQFGIDYANLQKRSAIEGWRLTYRGRPRGREYADEAWRAEKAQEQAQREAQQAELLVEARTVIFDTKKAELVAEKVLAQHSSQMKVALSELVVETAEELRSEGIKPKDKALAVDALKRVSERLYGWDLERELARMESKGAINLTLIATAPGELRTLGWPPEGDRQEGVKAGVEKDSQGMGVLVEEPEQARVEIGGGRSGLKEAARPNLENHVGAEGRISGSPAGGGVVSLGGEESFGRSPGWEEHRKANREREKYR